MLQYLSFTITLELTFFHLPFASLTHSMLIINFAIQFSIQNSTGTPAEHPVRLGPAADQI